MISRKCAKLIADTYELTFREYHSRSYQSGGYYNIDTDAVYDYLFENDYEAYFCNAIRLTYQNTQTRTFVEFIMKLHTGESLAGSTKEWEWSDREKLGQRLLQNLAENILQYWAARPKSTDAWSGAADSQRTSAKKLKAQLEIEGYEFKEGRLLESETNVLDLKQEEGVLRNLYNQLSLPNADVAFHHLDLTEEHYLAGKWEDSISNSRKFLEAVLQEIAATYSQVSSSQALDNSIYERPVKVREYLEREGLLEKKEKDALAAVYGLLSETGGHPNIAESDQARLLRNMALTFSHFAMLRLKGRLNQNPNE